VSLPSNERVSPRDIAWSAVASGRFHDVVIAASKVANNVPLAEADTSSLRWARQLLASAAGRTMVLKMPSAQQLAGTGTLAAAIRRAAKPEGGNPDEPLRELRTSIDKYLKGNRDEAVTTNMLAVRDLFAYVTRVGLQADVLSQGEPPAAGPWLVSTTNSLL
jgi:hypothetical protein